MSHIVLIEDDYLLAEHFSLILRREGHTVASISHAIGAIDLIDENTPDVIILDMLLIGSTAMPLLHELASHDDLSSIPVIIVSSLVDEFSLDTLRPYGVKAMLDKASLHPDSLVSTVKRVQG